MVVKGQHEKRRCSKPLRISKVSFFEQGTPDNWPGGVQLPGYREVLAMKMKLWW
jgi:hypothetical protein